jgi:RimJ/RimL family protein N-acetyltransferase
MLIRDTDYTKKLVFEGGYLKPLTIDDIHVDYINGLNDPDVNRYLVSVRAVPVTMESAKGFVESSRESVTEILFGIWVDGMKDFAGTVRAHSIEMENRTAKIGICIFDKECWGRGLGKAVIIKVTEWLHEVVGVRWVEAGVYGDNTASSRLFASAGYTAEYEINGKYLYDGKPVTVEMYTSKKNL